MEAILLYNNENISKGTNMEGLILKAGGTLHQVRWVYDEVKKVGEYVTTEVTNRAIAFLFEPIRFEGDIRLRDIFTLLQTDATFLSVFKRDWVAEYLTEMHKVEIKPYTGIYDPDGMEYLELYQFWYKDSQLNQISGVDRLDLHGIGYLLTDDVKQGDYVMHKKGSRINWGITGSQLGDLLDLPLRFNETVTVCEESTNVDNYGAAIDTMVMQNPTLGQVIHGVLWELSFHGGPEETAEFNESLNSIKEELDECLASGDTSRFVEVDFSSTKDLIDSCLAPVDLDETNPTKLK